MVRGRVVASLVGSVIAVVQRARGRGQSPSVDVPAVHSTTPMTRNADAMLSASILSTAAADTGLAACRRRSSAAPHPRGRLARAGKLALFDVPVVTYFPGLNHEWGHQTSADEFGVEFEAVARRHAVVVAAVPARWRRRRFRSGSGRGR